MCGQVLRMFKISLLGLFCRMCAQELKMLEMNFLG